MTRLETLPVATVATRCGSDPMSKRWVDLADVAQKLITAANAVELDIAVSQELQCHREQHIACRNGCVASLLCCLGDCWG